MALQKSGSEKPGAIAGGASGLRLFAVLFLAVTALASAAATVSSDQMSAFTPVSASQQAPALSLASFSAGAPAFQEGQDIYFTALVTNDGNMVTDALVQAYLFNSADSPIAAFNYTESNIGEGETLTFTKAWSTADLLPGNYTAFANVSYGGTVSNTLFTSFTVEPSSPAAGILITPNVSVVVLSQPPQITLPPENEGLLSYPILKEMSPGDNALIFPLLENQGQAAIYANVIPSGSGVAFSSAVTGVLLPPDKPTSVVIPIHVPQDVPVGYYEMSIEYSLNGTNVSQPLIIHVVPPQAVGLSVYREISIDYPDNDSMVQLSAVNNEAGSIDHAEVLEQVPSAFDMRGVSFTVPPTAMNGSLMRWDLVNLLPNETQALSYVLPGIPADLGLFTSWPPAQTLLIEPDFYRNILIGGFETADIAPGEKGNYTLELFNAGPTDESVAAEITGADGWNLEPDSFNVTVPSRATTELNFSLTAPANATDPVYSFTVYLDYGGVQDQKTLLVPLNYENLMTLPQYPLSQQLLGWALRNAYLFVLAALACVIAFLAIRKGYAESRKPRYSKKRVDSMIQFQQMFGDDERRN